MKITDKIVTLVGLPSMTNVVWHDPDTNELKIYNKNGWEVVGGSPGEGDSSNTHSNGYPVVTVEDDFNIEAEPNTFYNIKNNTDSEISINFKDGYSIEGSNKLLFINAELEGDENFLDLDMEGLFMFGIPTPIIDNTKDGYKYKTEVDLTVISNGKASGIMSIYFSDEIKNGNNVNCLINADTVGVDEAICSLNNIQIVNENNDYVVYITHPNLGSMPHIFTEIENDSNTFSHKYSIYGIFTSYFQYVYTTEPYISATDFYVDENNNVSDMGVTVEIKSNMYIPPCDTANEFVFNINSPANIIFTQEVKWHNDNIPDLTEEGVYTISIVNGVGCYTFITN